MPQQQDVDALLGSDQPISVSKFAQALKGTPGFKAPDGLNDGQIVGRWVRANSKSDPSLMNKQWVFDWDKGAAPPQSGSQPAAAPASAAPASPPKAEKEGRGVWGTLTEPVYAQTLGTGTLQQYFEKRHKEQPRGDLYHKIIDPASEQAAGFIDAVASPLGLLTAGFGPKLRAMRGAWDSPGVMNWVKNVAISAGKGGEKLVRLGFGAVQAAHVADLATQFAKDPKPETLSRIAVELAVGIKTAAPELKSSIKAATKYLPKGAAPASEAPPAAAKAAPAAPPTADVYSEIAKSGEPATAHTPAQAAPAATEQKSAELQENARRKAPQPKAAKPKAAKPAEPVKKEPAPAKKEGFVNTYAEAQRTLGADLGVTEKEALAMKEADFVKEYGKKDELGSEDRARNVYRVLKSGAERAAITPTAKPYKPEPVKAPVAAKPAEVVTQKLTQPGGTATETDAKRPRNQTNAALKSDKLAFDSIQAQLRKAGVRPDKGLLGPNHKASPYTGGTASAPGVPAEHEGKLGLKARAADGSVIFAPFDKSPTVTLSKRVGKVDVPTEWAEGKGGGGKGKSSKAAKPKAPTAPPATQQAPAAPPASEPQAADPNDYLGWHPRGGQAGIYDRRHPYKQAAAPAAPPAPEPGKPLKLQDAIEARATNTGLGRASQWLVDNIERDKTFPTIVQLVDKDLKILKDYDIRDEAQLAEFKKNIGNDIKATAGAVKIRFRKYGGIGGNGETSLARFEKEAEAEGGKTEPEKVEKAKISTKRRMNTQRGSFSFKPTDEDVLTVARAAMKRAGNNFREWSHAMIHDLSNRIVPHLRAIWEALGGK